MVKRVLLDQFFNVSSANIRFTGRVILPYLTCLLCWPEKVRCLVPVKVMSIIAPKILSKGKVMFYSVNGAATIMQEEK